MSNKLIDLKDLLEFCQAQALANKLYPDDEALWRSICRDYSKTFSTPYHEVLDMPPELVMLAYYESQYDDVDVEENVDKMLDIIYGLEDPEYSKQKKAEIDTFIEQAEEEERARLKAKKPIHPAMKAESTLIPETSGPSQGSIDLSYLEKEDNEGSFEE